MSKKSSVVDFLDLEIPISSVGYEYLREVVEQFKEDYVHMEREPRLKNGQLTINSNDLIALLGYIDSRKLSKLELKRFQTQAEKAIDQQLLRSVSVDKQSHYKWCLTALKTFEVGRFLG